MRLTSFYTIAGLLPDLEIRILIPKFLRPLARYCFGDRLKILENDSKKISLKYTSRGMRDLVKGFTKGHRYILPYQRAVIKDKKKRQLKDVINILLFNLAKHIGLVQIPDWKWINSYQGYLDIIGLNILKQIEYSDFVEQQQLDHNIIYHKLQQNLPVSPELTIPGDLKHNLLVFPTGTSRQFIPVSWARKYLPDAYYAFFFQDIEASEFEKAGLKTVMFYREPSDIIILSRNAKWTISTDSFPSHLLQSGSKRCTITITEVLKSRIISPAFEGKVINAEVPCHPCLHLDRKNHPTCMAGYTECLNWKNEVYTQNILDSVSNYDLICAHG
jgi:hypothetical protein